MNSDIKMSKSKKVSVVVPIFEDKEFLEESLGSLFKQTIADEIEIICVDDFSQDGTREVLLEMAKCHSNLNVILLDKNSSASECRRRGVLASKGEYIMFMDGDDFFSENACEVAYKAIKEKMVDIVQFETIIENCGNLPEARIKMNERMLQPYYEKELRGNLLSYCFRDKKFPINVWNKIYNGDKCRASFEKAEDAYLPKANDLYAAFLILDGASSYAAISDKLYHYCFGRGMTGKNVITLDSYTLLCQSARVYEALIRYNNKYRKDKIKEYGILVGSIKERFIKEQLNKWNTNVDESLKPKALETFYHAWNDDISVLISYFSKKNWYDRTMVANLIKDTNICTFKKRPIKTVALYYRNVKNGGAQRVVVDVANMFAAAKDADGKNKFKVVLVTDEQPSQDDYPLDKNIARCVLPNCNNSIGEKYKERSKAIISMIDKYKIDAFLNSMWIDATNFWDMLTIKGHKSHPACINHCHNYFGFIWKLLYDKAGETWSTFAMMDALVVLSTNDKFYWNNINKNTYFIKNPCCFTSEKYKEVQKRKDEKYILWLARISSEKQPMEMIRIMDYVAKEVPNAVCHMVGSGDAKLTEKLKNEVASRGLENNVKFEGFSLDVEQFYRQADVFVSTAEYEGYPLTFMESAAFGIPSVTYDLPWLEYYKMIDGTRRVPQLKAYEAANEIIKLVSDNEYLASQSMLVHESFKEQEKVTLEASWLEVFSNIENGVSPENHFDMHEAEIAISGLLNFHSLAIKTYNIKEKEFSTAVKENVVLNRKVNSKAFKFGNAVAYIPRKIKLGVKKLKK